MTFGLKISSDQVVTPHGVGAYDIYTQGTQIAAVCERGSVDLPAEREIDATGLVVVPGGIEAHTHINMPIWQVPGLKSQSADGASRACLFGGTTTIIDFAVVGEGADGPLAAVTAKQQEWSDASYADYAFRCTIAGAPTDAQLQEVAELVKAHGVPTFKIFTIGKKRVPDGAILRLLSVVKDAGGLLMVHAENDEMVNDLAQQHQAEGKLGFEYLTQVHSALSEEVAIRQVCRLAATTGTSLYFAHITSAQGLEAVLEARRRGQPVYAEVLHNYLAFDTTHYHAPDGVKYHTYPSLKTEADRQALWDALRTGGVSVVATDDVTTAFEVKTRFSTILDARGGHSGLDTRMPYIFSEGVCKAAMTLARFVDVTSTNPAKIHGLYPRKGAIAAGSDADLVVIDPNLTRTYDKSHVKENTDYSIWEGWRFQGWPRYVVLRGRLAVQDDELLVPLGYGEFVPGQIAPTVLEGPVC